MRGASGASGVLALQVVATTLLLPERLWQPTRLISAETRACPHSAPAGGGPLRQVVLTPPPVDDAARVEYGKQLYARQEQRRRRRMIPHAWRG